MGLLLILWIGFSFIASYSWIAYAFMDWSGDQPWVLGNTIIGCPMNKHGWYPNKYPWLVSRPVHKKSVTNNLLITDFHFY
ncbi:hypothetical protein VB264_19200 [Arcicella aquatica]|uniref:Uncharacterized protein n=1 Tax=Arcicella aquatica TaxID=217141 RepID=A0ABU5QS58_9BACT|nr:hypothetical protein [Arcicella aquatica]MEA5259933.1 hypothetical protein [Arcicella aquatica]